MRSAKLPVEGRGVDFVCHEGGGQETPRRMCVSKTLFHLDGCEMYYIYRKDHKRRHHH